MKLVVVERDANVAIDKNIPKAQFGTTADIEVATNSIQTIDVTFEKAFKSAPTVLCSIRSGTINPAYGSVNAFVDYSSVTKTGFTIKVANSATSGAVLRPAVSWIAIAQIFATPIFVDTDAEKETVEDQGNCNINEHTLDALIEPQKTGIYCLRFIYKIADETWVDNYKIKVKG